jgi:hypothetical protein
LVKGRLKEYPDPNKAPNYAHMGPDKSEPLLAQYRYTADVRLSLHCCYTVVTLLLHWYYTVVTLLLHC